MLKISDEEITDGMREVAYTPTQIQDYWSPDSLEDGLQLGGIQGPKCQTFTIRGLREHVLEIPHWGKETVLRFTGQSF